MSKLSRTAFAIALFGTSAGQVFADNSLVCDGKLQKNFFGKAPYFSPVGFKSLEIIPIGECVPEKPCSYDVFVKSGPNYHKEVSAVEIQSLCDSVIVYVDESNLKEETPISPKKYTDEGSVCYIPSLIELQAYDKRKIVTTVLHYVKDELNLEIMGRLYEYSYSDVDANSGIWHGDSSGGKLWNSLVTKEEVLTVSGGN